MNDSLNKFDKTFKNGLHNYELFEPSPKVWETISFHLTFWNIYHKLRPNYRLIIYLLIIATSILTTLKSDNRLISGDTPKAWHSNSITPQKTNVAATLFQLNSFLSTLEADVISTSDNSVNHIKKPVTKVAELTPCKVANAKTEKDRTNIKYLQNYKFHLPKPQEQNLIQQQKHKKSTPNRLQLPRLQNLGNTILKYFSPKGTQNTASGSNGILFSENPQRLFFSLQDNKENISEQKKLSIRLGTGPAYTYRVLSAYSSSEKKELSKRYTNDKGQIVLHSSLTLGYHLKNSTIDLGLMLNRYKTLGNYSYTQYQTNSSIIQSVDSIFDMAIDTISTYFDSTTAKWVHNLDTNYNMHVDTNTYVHIDTTGIEAKSMRSFHDLHYLEVPLIYSYCIKKNKYKISLGAGMSFGILSGSSGKIFRTSSQIIVSTDKQKLPFREMNLFLIAQIGISRELSKHVDMSANLSYKQSILSVYSDRAYPANKPYSLALNFGLRYYL